MRMRRPLIGITGPAENSHILWFFTRLAIKQSKGRPRTITAMTDPLRLQDYDGFVIMGGGDINPERYGESAVLAHKQYDLKRDALEAKVVRHAYEHGVPLLGICRGMQMINVALGGALHQEAKDVLEDFLPNERLISKIIGRRQVSVDPQSRLFKILGEYITYHVNSIHHQAVHQPGKGMHVVAQEENGLIQAVENDLNHPHPFFIGVQWHPELMLHAPSSRRLFRALVRSAMAE